MEKPVAIILGGLGLIGRELCEILKSDYIVICADNKPRSDASPENYEQVDITDSASIDKLLERKPQLIINCVNVATIFSKNPQQGYAKLVNFYTSLYRQIMRLPDPVLYLQMGTTGSGGLGLNIPFTHGDKIEDLPIINKAAFAGIGTSLLTLMSRSFNGRDIRISEIKPGLALFAETVSRTKDNDTEIVTVDGGESGSYTYNEFMLLTSFMGFSTVKAIGKKVIGIVNAEKSQRSHSHYDIIENINQTIVSEDDDDRKIKAEIAQRMRELDSENSIIATGNLGPPSLTRDLILATLIKAGNYSDESQFNQAVRGNSSVTATLKYISETSTACAEYLSKEVNYQGYLALKPFATAGELWEIVCSALKGTTSDLS